MKVASRGKSRRSAAFAIILVLGLAVLGIWLWQTRVTMVAARLVLTPVAFADLPGWRTSDARPALAAFRRSCAAPARQASTHTLGGTGYAGQATDWEGVCAAAPSGNVGEDAARAFFENSFTPVAVATPDGNDTLFTGYYEPEVRASRRRHAPYDTPIYGLPDDLVNVDLGLFRDDLKSQHITGRLAGHTLVPYFTRAEIDAGNLNHAQVLLYADDPVQVFFLHIQGSGRARFDNGAVVRLAYAGQNGRPYTPVGRILIEEGAIGRDQMSMQAIRNWLRTHGDAARRVMESDRSFVFFREAPLGDPSLGSEGSEGVALTPQASIAVDMHVHPLGVPFYIATTAPSADPSRADRPLDRLVVAQDTGGAIKGALRADVFWGFGPDAESIAGRMKSTGHMFVLLPKSVALRLPVPTIAGGQ